MIRYKLKSYYINLFLIFIVEKYIVSLQFIIYTISNLDESLN